MAAADPEELEALIKPTGFFHNKAKSLLDMSKALAENSLARRVGPEPEQAPTRAALCASTVLGLALTRYVLRFEASVALSREEIVDWLGPTIQRYLTAPTP